MSDALMTMSPINDNNPYRTYQPRAVEVRVMKPGVVRFDFVDPACSAFGKVHFLHLSEQDIALLKEAL